jgi:hypothetical protein
MDAPSPGFVPSPAPQAILSSPEIGGNSPFEIAVKPDPPAMSAVVLEDPAAVATLPPAESHPPPTVPDKDRVDGLLRQFLARYDQGNG